jgi:hypothetical protein
MRDAIEHVRPPADKHLCHGAHKVFGRPRPIPEIAIHLALDIEQDGVVGRACHKVEHLAQRRDGRAGEGLLEREIGETERAAVERLELRERQVGNVLPDVGVGWVGREGGRRVETFGRVDGLVVPDDNVVVFGETACRWLVCAVYRSWETHSPSRETSLR